MSAENVAVVRSVYDNFAKGDIAAVFGVLSPDIEWVENSQEFLPHRGTHRGPAAVGEKVFGTVMQYFDEFAVVAEVLHDAGDVVVVEGRAVGKTKAGEVLDAPACWVWTVRDGKAVSNHNYHDTDAWRQVFQPE
ncbi:MAG TPA: nuclear transport factor 2 family protein [Acidimicrobiales bacterium]|nr:nuclear transport factor 2 family protein [Acidimicrobiales bacterium]